MVDPDDFARRVKQPSAMQRDSAAAVGLLTGFLFLFIAHGTGLKFLGIVPVLGSSYFIVNAVRALREGRKLDPDADNPYARRRRADPVTAILIGLVMCALGLGAMGVFK